MDTDTRNAILGKIGHQIGGENTLILFNLFKKREQITLPLGCAGMMEHT